MHTDTPELYRDYLDKLLEGRRPAIERYCKYYEGNHPLTFATTKYREVFGSVFKEFADNWMRLIVDSSVERLRIIGFDYGDAELNAQAQAFWDHNYLDAESSIAHTEAVKAREAYLLVDPYVSPPRVTVEHPLQVYVETDPANRRDRLAGYKKWRGADGHAYCSLYLPDVVYNWRSAGRVSAGSRPTWEPFSEVANPFGVVPLIPLQNNPSALGGGTSDLDDVIPLNDALNKVMTDMLVSSEYFAYPQRVITGLEVPLDPETGEPIPLNEIKAAQQRVWTFEKDVSVSQLGELNLSNYSEAADTYLRHIAAISKVPPHYLLGQIANISSDALIAAEAGLVSKVHDKQRHFGIAWLEAMRLCFAAVGRELDWAQRGRVQWADPESKNITRLADPVSKLSGVLSREAQLAELGYAPDEVQRIVAQQGLPDRSSVTPDVTSPNGGDSAGSESADSQQG